MNEENPFTPYQFYDDAMATTFRILIDDTIEREKAEKAVSAAFRELHQLEDELSRYRDLSDISILNKQQAGGSVPIRFAAYDCLSLAKEVHKETGGAFDVTVGPLMNAWVHKDGFTLDPSEEEIAEAMARVGLDNIEIDGENFRATTKVDNPVVDLGGIGKGYALDQLADLLREWDCERAILNAGQSTLLALDAPLQNPDGWPVTAGGGKQRFLCNRALSGSGFEERGAHVIDPRTSGPVPIKKRIIWSMAPYAALADALSTSFLVMSNSEIKQLCKRYPDVEVIFA
ncbi:MAG: FAD:protein FMN transferase [Verrucomicrobiota bacterium]